MKRSFFILALFSTIALTYSCSKDDDSVAQMTKTEMISRAWKISTLNVTVAGITYNAMDSMPSCFKDNLYKFTSAGIYSSEEGLTKCNASDPTVEETGTWLFMVNETKLKMNVNSWEFPDDSIPWDDEIAWDLVSLSATRMELTYTIPASADLPEIKLQVIFIAA